MKMKLTIKIAILFFGFLYISSCKKYLENPPNKALLVPTTTADLQALLNEQSVMNEGAPCLTDFATDDAFYSYSQWQGLAVHQTRNSYVWAEDIFEGEASFDWNAGYATVYYANVVLDGLSKFTDSQDPNYNIVKGRALFYRAISFYNLQEEFGEPYDLKTSKSDLGIIIKLTPNLDAKVSRSSVQATYNQILDDLSKALNLLPNTADLQAPTTPTKAAVYGLLARVNLSLRNYEEAGINADNCLKMYNKLTDYNTIKSGVRNPFGRQKSVEIIFENEQILSYQYDLGVDTSLYKQYDSNDLRKQLFFRFSTNNSIVYNGTYGFIAGTPSNSLCTDEMYLIRAEANARLGHLSIALDDLNTLLIQRFKTGTYIPFSSTNTDTLLNEILIERRKELLYRGLRWTDLRRLNKEPKFAKTITRVLNGQLITLPANDAKYAYPIPIQETQLTGIPQNNR